MSGTTRPQRRFPPPWRVVDIPGGYVVEDSTSMRVAYVYKDTNKAAGASNQAPTKDEARRIAVNIVKLPELLAR